MVEEITRIRIRCGEKGRGHRAKGVIVTSFIYHGEGQWTEHAVGPWRAKHLTPFDGNTPDSGNTLAGDSPNIDHDRLFSDEAHEYRRTLRNVYSLACPVCAPGRTPAQRSHGRRRGPSVDLTQEQLHAALNQARLAGITELDLALLAAIIQGMAQA